MTCKKKKRKKKRKVFGFLEVKDEPTALDVWRENREQKKNQDDYFG